MNLRPWIFQIKWWKYIFSLNGPIQRESWSNWSNCFHQSYFEIWWQGEPWVGGIKVSSYGWKPPQTRDQFTEGEDPRLRSTKCPSFVSGRVQPGKHSEPFWGVWCSQEVRLSLGRLGCVWLLPSGSNSRGEQLWFWKHSWAKNQRCKPTTEKTSLESFIRYFFRYIWGLIVWLFREGTGCEPSLFLHSSFIIISSSDISSYILED